MIIVFVPLIQMEEVTNKVSPSETQMAACMPRACFNCKAP